MRAILDDADRIVKEQRERFSRPDGPDALLAYSAALRFRDHPADALAAGRAIKEPFYASLAIGAMAARQLAGVPDNAAKLLLEAQGRAMAINHWSGSDATSMGYLFQVVPLFEQPLAERVLDASHANLRKWATDGQTSQHPMLMLSRATMAVKPGGVASLLDEITANRSFRSHHYDSVGLLSEFRFQNEKKWAAGQVDAFYKSGQDWPWPACETTLGGLLLADAMHDLPRALKRIATLPEGQQDIGRCAVMDALRGHGRAKEAQGVLELIEARAKAGAKQPDWISRTLPDVRPRWAAENKTPPSVRPADIDRFLADPTAGFAPSNRGHARGNPLPRCPSGVGVSGGWFAAGPGVAKPPGWRR